MPEIDTLDAVMKNTTLKIVIMAVCASGSFFPFDGVSAQSGQESHSAPEFFSDLQDVPLMDGMQEMVDRSFTFDKPEGRITESVASVPVQYSRDQVISYYQAVLPSFGWGRVQDLRFYRENEVLELEFLNEDGGRYLKITMKPTL